MRRIFWPVFEGLSLTVMLISASVVRGAPSGDKGGERQSQHELTHIRPIFENASRYDDDKYATHATIEALNATIPDEYHLGPGDVVDIQVWDQEPLSGQHTIGPDGTLAMPLVGELKVEGMTRTKAANLIRDQLGRFYQDPFVNLQILQYNNNRVYVLGRVSNPGMIRFEGRPTLLEALSLAGSIPVLDESTQLTKCAVIRGKDQIIWIDLKELLAHGNMSLNLRLANKDVIFIPDGRDALVYVMGEVETPGAYRITPEMSFLDALMMAGGVTIDGKKTNMALIRNVDGKAYVMKIGMGEFRRGDFSKNVLLKENDIIYIYRKGIARFNYILRQVSPFATWILLSDILDDTPER